MSEAPIFCVDGGGTRSRGRIVLASGETLAEAVAGPCNPSSDLSLAVSSITQLWADIAVAAGFDPQAPSRCRLSIGTAGALHPEIRNAFLSGLPVFAERHVMTDGYAALVGASGGEPAGLLVMGTGTVAHRLFADGISIQRDGWGWVAGDRGSAAWIGRKAVEHALAARDEVVAPDDLSAAVWNDMGGEPDAVRSWLRDARQARFAGIAPLVGDAAEAGNATATGILDHAADHGADLLRSLALEEDEPVFLRGGVAEFLHDRLVRRYGRNFAGSEGDAMHGCFLVATGAAPREVRR
ncbi:glucosamine kinase [Faunimonas pinastri]|uniref:Glucosamine kinase n=1 Tax=Faunimonas pinastri TaxID=1855383 RepID=A0A1H9NSD0_9HYPH|nr:BadF/BadG/BcrA/BcrD ATPase family protein [Faunimonas pinastri]SER38870.1 glucosamine kinase [Faunimonas pinastri]